MSDGDDTLDPLPNRSGQEHGDEPARAQLESLVGPDQTLDALVAEFLEVMDSTDAVDETDFSSILEMLQNSIDDGSVTADELRRLLEDGPADDAD